MASLLKILQEKSMTEYPPTSPSSSSSSSSPSSSNPMWPIRLPPELLQKIAEYVPANLPTFDTARFDLWKKGGVSFETIANADAQWFNEGFSYNAHTQKYEGVKDQYSLTLDWTLGLAEDQMAKYQAAKEEEGGEEKAWDMLFETDVAFGMYSY